MVYLETGGYSPNIFLAKEDTLAYISLEDYQAPHGTFHFYEANNKFGIAQYKIMPSCLTWWG